MKPKKLYVERGAKWYDTVKRKGVEYDVYVPAGSELKSLRKWAKCHIKEISKNGFPRLSLLELLNEIDRRIKKGGG